MLRKLSQFQFLLQKDGCSEFEAVWDKGTPFYLIAKPNEDRMAESQTIKTNKTVDDEHTNQSVIIKHRVLAHLSRRLTRCAYSIGPPSVRRRCPHFQI